MTALDLHLTRTGSGPARPVLIAHGLFGSGRNWGRIARALGDRGPVLSVDMRNHGASPWAETHSYPEMAADLARVIAAERRPIDVLGHSMGGKAAMVLALSRPDLVDRLIVADIAPIAYRHTQAHLVEAMTELDLAAIASRRDADRALSDQVREPDIRGFLLHSLDMAGATPRWRLNLDVIGAEMALLLDFPRVSGRFSGPTLFLRGDRSDYVPDAALPEIRTLFPAARVETLPDAGHWLHAENPEAFTSRVRAFLDRS